MNRALRALLLPVLLTLLGALSGCAGDASTNQPDGFNQADVAFAGQLIPHHRQSLQLVRMIEEREVGPGLDSLAAQIRTTQVVEIQSMSSWLKDWNVPVPSGDPSEGTGRAGTVSAADLAALAKLPAAEFEDQWLRLMIRHHEEAIAMADTENEDGRYPYARALAQTVLISQQSEIRTMETLLG